MKQQVMPNRRRSGRPSPAASDGEGLAVEQSTWRLAVLDTHPVQYKAPFYRALAAHPEIDLTVYYGDRFNVSSSPDPQFGVATQWDVPLLDGYRHEFLRNYSPRRLKGPYGFFGVISPEVLAVLRREAYDAVIVYGYDRLFSLSGIAGAKLGSTPIIFRGEADLLERRAWHRRVLKQWLIPRILRVCDAVMYSCGTNAEYFAHYEVPSERMFFFPCAVDNDFFQERARALASQQAQLRRANGIPEDARVALFVGRLTEWKRPLDALQALQKLRDDPDLWLVIVGDGPQRTLLEDYVREHDLPRAHLAGFKNQSELPEWYTMADALVIPSSRDPSPKVMNEAMNFSLPVIASNQVGTARDLVENGGNGYTYPVGNIDALAGYLRAVLSDPDRCHRMGQRSLERVGQWSFDGQVEGIVQALRNVTEARTA